MDDGHAPGVDVAKFEYGNWVKIRHPNGYETRYAHLFPNTIAVRVGDRVSAGQLLGLSDNTGMSTGPHLHFEVRDPSGRRVNPYGNPPDYVGGCGPGALWATCPPTPYQEPIPQDEDSDDFSAASGDCDDHNSEIHPAADELCDGVDNNCDGVTDRGVSIVGNPQCSVGTGACTRGGQHACGRDDEIICDATPGLPTFERCNGVDDDCDGATDEDFRSGLANDIGNPCTVGRGVCTNPGTWACAPDGRATVCSGTALPPQSETCNEFDDDCDGIVDNPWRSGLASDLGRSCAITWDSCGTTEGVYICTPDGLATVCNADPPDTWHPEVCNSEDDDCNGVVDDVSESVLASDASNCGRCWNNCLTHYPLNRCIDGHCYVTCWTPLGLCNEYCRIRYCPNCSGLTCSEDIAICFRRCERDPGAEIGDNLAAQEAACRGCGR